MTSEATARARPPQAPEGSRRLPLGVWILAGIQALLAAWALAGLVGLRPLDESSGLGVLSASADILRAILIGIVAIQILATFGLLLRVRAAWVAVMVLTGISLALGLWAFTAGVGNPPRLAVDVAAALYLNQLAVRRVFGVDRAGRRVDLIVLEEDNQ
ncbi:MAG: hypothetical protein H6Q36_1704 [Chloroflexi bacterium]|jgi:hypothetical protein|nr:hypothetical protein [Chloroflexota bacterium]